MPEIGEVQDICGACSYRLPLSHKCMRTFCEHKPENKMGSTADLARDFDPERTFHDGVKDRRIQATTSPLPPEPSKKDLTLDSGNAFLLHLEGIARDDAVGLKKAQESYGNSWKSRGGVGAFMMLARKWDRLENRVKKLDVAGNAYDIFSHIANDERSEGIIDDVRDLRRYLLLVESEMVARGFDAAHRDNG